MSNSSEVGAEGERLALEFLTKNNYRIVCANFKTPVGRNRRGAIVTGEIDLIVYDAATLCFIEVKTRRSDAFASPLAAIDLRKQRQIIRAARMYRKIFHLRQVKFRYDAISIVLPKNSKPKVEYFKSFWTESKFRKNFWADEY
ncbi:MAG: YraN family protein [Pyrinomonadaceae bacterium]